MTDLNSIVDEYNATKAKFQEDVKEKMKVAFTQFFNDYPEFRSIEWTQYTPYFMDGDPCEFRVNDKNYTAQPEWYLDEDVREQIENDDYSVWDLEEHRVFEEPSAYERKSAYHKVSVAAWDALPQEKKDRANTLQDAWNRFSTTLDKIDDELFLDVFGDHKHVIVTKDGITIKRYDHD